MKFMVTWKIPTDSYDDAVQAFVSSGASVPEGLSLLGRWHAPGSGYGWLLVEIDDAVALAEHMAEWASLLELNISPVIED